MTVVAFPRARAGRSAVGSTRDVGVPDAVEEFLSRVERLSLAEWRVVFAAWKELRGDPEYQPSLVALRRAGQQRAIDAARRGDLRDLANRRALIVLKVSTIVQRLLAVRDGRRPRGRNAYTVGDALIHAAAALLVREHLVADVVTRLYGPFEHAIPLATLTCRPSAGPRLVP